MADEGGVRSVCKFEIRAALFLEVRRSFAMLQSSRRRKCRKFRSETPKRGFLFIPIASVKETKRK